MTQTAIKRVVVGVDGSDNSAAALEWAIQFAHLTGAEIVAVFAISPTSAVEYVGPTAFGPFPAVPPELDPAWRSAATQEFVNGQQDLPLGGQLTSRSADTRNPGRRTAGSS